jgi:hypothetical protein
MNDAPPEPSPLRPLLFIFGMPLILAALYYGRLAYEVQQTRYTWKEMDWNGDGRTSIREYFQTVDVLERKVERDGVECLELYEARRGKVLRVECP